MTHPSLATLLLLFLGVGACEPRSLASGETTGAEHPPAVAASAAPGHDGRVDSLAGEWRVAGIDGRPLDEPVALALTGDERRLWWEPRCAGMARTYRLDGHRITFHAAASKTPEDGATPPVCAIALPPRLAEVMRALDGAERIVRTESNGVLISGPDHEVTLFSQ